MGAITSRLPFFGSSGSSNKTIAKLTRLQDDIERLEKKRVQVKNSQALMLKRMFMFTCSFTLSYAVVAYTVFPKILLSTGVNMDFWLDWMLVWSPVLVLPILYFLLKKQVIRWYTWRHTRWTKSIHDKRKQKKSILDNVMDVETYNNAMKIFEQFDRSRLTGAPKLRANSYASSSRETVQRFGFTNAPRSASVRKPETARKTNDSSVSRSSSISSAFGADRIRNLVHNYTFSGTKSRKPDEDPVVTNVRRRNLNQTVSSTNISTVATMRNAEKPVKIGPAAPGLDAEALKMFSKKQGIIAKKRRPKKQPSVPKELPEEEQSSTERPAPTLQIPEEKLAGMTKSPRTVELSDAKSKIQELEAELARLRTLEEQRNNQISVAGKINKEARSSQKTSSSRAQLIMRAKHIEKQAEKERNKKSRLADSTDSRPITTEPHLRVMPSASQESLNPLPISQSPSQNSLVTSGSSNVAADETLVNSARGIVTDDDSEVEVDNHRVRLISEKDSEKQGSERDDDEGKGNSRDELSIEQEPEEEESRDDTMRLRDETVSSDGEEGSNKTNELLSHDLTRKLVSDESDEEAKEVTENESLVTPIQSSSSDEMVT